MADSPGKRPLAWRALSDADVTPSRAPGLSSSLGKTQRWPGPGSSGAPGKVVSEAGLEVPRLGRMRIPLAR
jgi:hypothetical protein